MKILKTVFTFALVCAAFFASCDFPFDPPESNPPASQAPAEEGYGKLRIQFAGGEARTVFPVAEFDSYKYTFTKMPAGSPQVLVPVDELFTLETGDWKVEVIAYVGVSPTQEQAARGETLFTLTASPTPVTITILLEENAHNSGTGRFSYTIQHPGDSTITRLTMTKLPDMTDFELDPSTVGNTFTETDLAVPAGYYRLNTVLLNDGGFAGITEIVHIYPLMKSEFTVTFNADDFSKIPLSITVTAPPAGALTPLAGELSTAFTVAVKGFTGETDASGVKLDIGGVTGLSFSGHDAASPAAGGIKTFTVTVTYNGTQAFGSGTANISISGLTDIPDGYRYPFGTQNVNVTVTDGQAAGRAIPVTQANIEDFNTYASTANGLQRHYKLAGNVTLSGSDNWIAIGDDSDQFAGSFDGGGYSIAGLAIDSAASDYQGMFGYIGAGGSVENLALPGINVSGGDYTGGIAGASDGAIENCYTSGSVKGGGYSGGIAGASGGAINNCFSSAAVTGSDYAGGLAGDSSGTVQNNIAINEIITITGSGSNYGRVQGSSSGTLSGNYAFGDMLFTANGALIITFADNAGGKDGKSLTAAAIKTKAAWESAGFLFTDSSPTAGFWGWTGTGMPNLYKSAAQDWPVNMIDLITINEAAIPGIAAPATGEAPPSAPFASNSQYAVTAITWTPAVTTAFAASTTYKADITLKAEAGYTLRGVAENFFTVAGVQGTNSAESGAVTVTFNATAATINIAAIQGVTAPVAGESPVTAITASAQYTGTVAWNPDDSVFAAGEIYTATITLTPVSGYTLHGVTADYFTVAGASPNNAANSGVVTAVFPATDSKITILAIPDVTKPATGATSVAVINSDEYTGSVAWSPNDSVFAAGTVYTASITLTPKTGYTLYEVAANSFTVAGSDSASNSANSGAVTAVFPATSPQATFIFNWDSEQYEIIFDPDSITLSLTGGVVPYTIDAESAGYSGYTWYVNGMEDEGQAGSPAFEFDYSALEPADYTITLEAYYGAVPYSGDFTVTIVP